MPEETKLKGNCQHCGGNLKFVAHMTGMEVTCPHCRQVTALQVVFGPLVPTEVSSQPAAPQSICPKCRVSIDVNDRVCVQCGSVIPQPINWVRWGAIVLIVLQLGYLLLRWSGLDPRVQHAFRAKLGFAKAGAYAGSVTTKKRSADDGSKGDGPDDVFTPPPETGAPRLLFARQPELKEEGNFYFITGIVQNNSETDTYFEVGVQFLLQDTQGKPLGIVRDSVGFLDPGKTWDFRVLVVDPDATQYVLQGNIEGTR